MYKVYIVEDSKIIADILKKIISSIPSIDTKTYSTGEAMLNDLKNKVPDMIFLDYYLYEHRRTVVDHTEIMNGDMVLEQVKKSHPNIPVVLLTGMNDKAKIEELSQMGFCCVIKKEADDIYTEVINCVNKHLMISV